MSIFLDICLILVIFIEFFKLVNEFVINPANFLSATESETFSNIALESYKKFHDTACRYLTVTLGDSDGQSKREVEAEFKNASADVIAAIDLLKDAIETARQNTAYTSQFIDTATSHPTAWDESLIIGLPVIDEQHKAITGILDKLMKNPDASLHSEYAVDNLTELGKILELHISIEEAYMKRLGMEQEEFDEHCRSHKNILDQFVEMNIASYSNRDLKVKDIASQVREWSIDHVVEYDFNIKKYLPARDHS